jgi:hypothetical protein
VDAFNSEDWVQPPLFEPAEKGRGARAEPAVPATAPPQPPPRRPAYRASHVHVSSDEDVARSSDEGSRMSAEITWQLAKSLTDEQLAELRARLNPPAA